MTAKHSPATSLPWKLKQDKAAPYSGIYTETGKQITHENGATSDENAAYIVHAANAYPKLVEALRETLRDRLTQANLHQLPPGIRARLESARALLRELGEAE
jgi:hypothetical protein